MPHCQVKRKNMFFCFGLKKYRVAQLALHIKRFLFLAGVLKIHSGGSSSQQTVLTIPANQLKQLGVGCGSAGMQTLLMPVSKGKVESTNNDFLIICLKTENNG